MRLSDNQKTLFFIFLVGLVHGLVLEAYEGRTYRTPGAGFAGSVGIALFVVLISWFFLKWKSARAAWICCICVIGVSWFGLLNN